MIAGVRTCSAPDPARTDCLSECGICSTTSKACAKVLGRVTTEQQPTKALRTDLLARRNSNEAHGPIILVEPAGGEAEALRFHRGSPVAIEPDAHALQPVQGLSGCRAALRRCRPTRRRTHHSPRRALSRRRRQLRVIQPVRDVRQLGGSDRADEGHPDQGVRDLGRRPPVDRPERRRRRVRLRETQAARHACALWCAVCAVRVPRAIFCRFNAACWCTS